MMKAWTSLIVMIATAVLTVTQMLAGNVDH